MTSQSCDDIKKLFEVSPLRPNDMKLQKYNKTVFFHFQAFVFVYLGMEPMLYMKRLHQSFRLKKFIGLPSV